MAANRVAVRGFVRWYDVWIGAFIERSDPESRWVVYVCPLPMIGLRIAWGVPDGR